MLATYRARYSQRSRADRLWDTWTNLPIHAIPKLRIRFSLLESPVCRTTSINGAHRTTLSAQFVACWCCCLSSLSSNFVNCRPKYWMNSRPSLDAASLEDFHAAKMLVQWFATSRHATAFICMSRFMSTSGDMSISTFHNAPGTGSYSAAARRFRQERAFWYLLEISDSTDIEYCGSFTSQSSCKPSTKGPVRAAYIATHHSNLSV